MTLTYATYFTRTVVETHADEARFTVYNPISGLATATYFEGDFRAVTPRRISRRA